MVARTVRDVRSPAFLVAMFVLTSYLLADATLPLPPPIVRYDELDIESDCYQRDIHALVS